jgi:hypothetical protein
VSLDLFPRSVESLLQFSKHPKKKEFAFEYQNVRLATGNADPNRHENCWIPIKYKVKNSCCHTVNVLQLIRSLIEQFRVKSQHLYRIFEYKINMF